MPALGALQSLKTLSTPILAELAKDHSGWYEVYDFYLPAAVDMPVIGSTSIVRITNAAGMLSPGVSGMQFYPPQQAPEPEANWPDLQSYLYWNVKREAVKSSGKFQNDKMGIAVQNVSQEFATLFSAVEWESVKVVVRKINSSIAVPTVDDMVLVFSGSVDSAKITLQQLSFACSNDMGSLSVQLPRENMHPSCRFTWGDDMCTALKFAAANYKSKTCAISCTTTTLLSADFLEDTLDNTFETAPGGFTDLIDALPDASITTSSDTAGYSGIAITFTPRGTIGASLTRFIFRFNDSSKSVKLNQRVRFTASGGTMPTGLAAATWYYVALLEDGGYFVSATLGGAVIYPSTAGSLVTLETESDLRGSAVKASNNGYWSMVDTDWGDNDQGYWRIPDVQAGTRNVALKPAIHFDFGSAKQPKLWQVSSIGGGRENMVRLILFFSSVDNATWVFESYFEMPPIGDKLFDVHIPNAASARYWRVCVRSRWSETYRTSLFATMKAYEGLKNYWRAGFVTFDATTATVALRGLSFPVFASFYGAAFVGEMPVAPASGDTFKIERGCARTFNDCCEKKNTGNFGGFDSMPFETVVR